MDEQPSQPPAPRPLSYATPEPGISRRAFRLLLVLTAMNTVLLGWFVLGPQLHGYLRAEWAAYQQRQVQQAKEATDRAARLAMLPTQEAAMRYVVPAGTIVYRDGGTELQRREAQLAATTRPADVVWPGTVPPPAPLLRLPATIPGWGQLGDAEKQVIFLHERTPPGRTGPTLVVVLAGNKGGTRRISDGRSFLSQRGFTVLTLEPATADLPLRCVAWSSYVWDPLENSNNSSPATWSRAADTRLSVQFGQPDPNDPGRFTIRYDIDGEPGELIGQLAHDGKVRLAPTGPMLPAWTQSTR